MCAGTDVTFCKELNGGMIQKMILNSKPAKIVSLLFACLLFAIAMNLLIYVFLNRFGHFSLLNSDLRTYKNSLAVLVLSNRDAIDRREVIRKSWAIGYSNVFFVVGVEYCQYPPENRITGMCKPNNYTLNKEHFNSYNDKEHIKTRQLLNEPDVILVPTGDDISELPKKVIQSYRWALQSLRTDWFLHVMDTIDVEIDKLETHLKTEFGQFKNTVILSSLNRESAVESEGKGENKPVFLGQFLCGLNHVVSRSVAQYTVNGFRTLFEYIRIHTYDGIRIKDSIKITSERLMNYSFIAKDGCKVTTTLHLYLCFKQIKMNCFGSSSVKTLTSKQARTTTYSTFENPSTYLNSDRFDVLVKMVYAHFYVFKNRIPKVIKEAYEGHIKVWNNFHEYCGLKKVWYDAKRPCKAKRNRSNFISSYHNTIDSIKKFGFNSTISQIPVDKEGFHLNGAHRLAASVVLSENATFDHQNYKQHLNWGYKYFIRLGLSKKACDVIMLEWMKLQLQLPNLKKLVSITSIFSNNPKKDEAMRTIVKESCSKDNGILYERTIGLTKKGARELITHMYGQQSWLETKIQQMLSKFEFSTFKVLILFIYGKDQTDLVQCKDKIRKLYNDKIFKSTVHIPDTFEENLILAEMILNPNSVQLINHANNVSDCSHIAREIASRSSTPPMKTLSGIYVGRDDIMIDSGAVLGFFGLRRRTDVDILFLQNIDGSILGTRNGINIQAHAFKFNSISKERAWGEDHFNETGPRDQWDLFFDPQNYGYCYGIKFVALKQLVTYKIKRNEPRKDQYDVRVVKELLKSIAS